MEDDYKNISDSWLDSKAEEAEQKELYSKEVYKKLDTDDAFVNYFKDFDESSVQQFKDYYVQQRTHWHFTKHHPREFKSKLNERFYEFAKDSLRNIQIKKLFNIIASWMNKECEFDDILVSRDWDSWIAKPFSCPYITPISEEEVNCYIKFIQQMDESLSIDLYHIYLYSFNFLEESKKGLDRWIAEGEYEDQEECYPSWFTFFDNHFDTAHYKLKPGTRINNEFKYVRHYNKIRRANNPCKEPSLPNIFYHDEKENFINLFEDKEFKHLYNAYKRNMDRNCFGEMIEMEIIYLCEALEFIPIQANEDWRVAVKLACEYYHREKTVQLIENVYEEYLILQNMEGGFEDWEDNEKNYAETSKTHIENILAGRKLMGEPEDLNF